MKKKMSILSLILALIMCFSFNSINVSANDDGPLAPPPEGIPTIQTLAQNYAYTDNKFDVVNGNIFAMSCIVTGNNATTQIEGHILLRRYVNGQWVQVYSSTATGSGPDFEMPRTYVATQSGRYCCDIYGYVTGTAASKEFFINTYYANV